MKKLTKLQWFAEVVHMQLNEIKCHLCNNRQFEGGVELGSLKQFVSDYSGVKGLKDYDEENEIEEEDEENDSCDRKIIDEQRNMIGKLSVQNLKNVYEINAIKAKNFEFTNFIKKILEKDQIDLCCIPEASDLIGAFKN